MMDRQYCNNCPDHPGILANRSCPHDTFVHEWASWDFAYVSMVLYLWWRPATAITPEW